jgi:hypothetical protein
MRKGIIIGTLVAIAVIGGLFAFGLSVTPPAQPPATSAQRSGEPSERFDRIPPNARPDTPSDAIPQTGRNAPHDPRGEATR